MYVHSFKSLRSIRMSLAYFQSRERTLERKDASSINKHSIASRVRASLPATTARVIAKFLFIRYFFLFSLYRTRLERTLGLRDTNKHSDARYVYTECGDEHDGLELVPNIIVNPGYRDAAPPPRRYVGSIIRAAEPPPPGPGKPRKVWFSSILNFRIFYRTDSGLISW